MNNVFDKNALTICSLNINGCALFGKKELEQSLQSCGAVLKHVHHWTKTDSGESAVIVIGTTDDRRVQILLENEGIHYRLGSEGVIYQWCHVRNGVRILLLAGTDETGLMYGLLEISERIQSEGFEALNRTENLTESPDNAIRCVDRYVVGHLDDLWLKSDAFWRYYLSRLAKTRFNRFCLILGFDTPYMTPPYPFFVDVNGYPQVSVNGQDNIKRDGNLSALRLIGSLCHEYGLKYTFATWQQKPWTIVQEPLVSGLPDDEEGLSAYCYEGLKSLLRAVPEIDIVQFRVNHESGVGTQVSAEDFWNRCTDAVADVVDEDARPLILDLRAKGLMDSMIDHAFSRGLTVEVPTKYWCEHCALPYHISIMRSEELAQLDNFNHSRRYSYADMLRKPKYYDVIYRLWNYGSTNLFLWGDADYARRFSQSCTVSGSAGLEINAPLALKYGYEILHKENWHTFADPSLRSGAWEDERFWMWYMAYGRLGYNVNASPEIWMRAFRAHFGWKSAPYVERSLKAASKIVPFVTAIHMPVHPSLQYWTEMNTGWAMFSKNNLNKPEPDDFQKVITYGNTEPGDHGLFYGIDEFAADLQTGNFKGRYSPLQSASYLEIFALDAYRNLEAADAIDENSDNPEYRAFRTDILLLRDFAMYHANKIKACFALALYNLTGDKQRLGDSAFLLAQALKDWMSLSDLGLRAYYHDLEFSSAGTTTRHGTWRDLQCEIEADLTVLHNMLTENGLNMPSGIAYCYEPKPFDITCCTLSSELPKTHRAGAPLSITVKASALSDIEGTPLILHYRHTNQLEGVFKTLPMEKMEDGFEAVIQGEYITSDWDLMVYITLQKKDGSCLVYPGIYHPSYPYPYHVISVQK